MTSSCVLLLLAEAYILYFIKSANFKKEAAVCVNLGTGSVTETVIKLLNTSVVLRSRDSLL